MSPATAAQQTSQSSPESADRLRGRMYSDPEFMAGIRHGLEEEGRGEGMTVEEYVKSRGIQ